MATMTMPKVERCRVAGCCYNKGEICHALAITIGGEDEHPACDTFCNYRTKGGDELAIAGVGACKVNSCQYNQSLECTANGITVGVAQDEADCLTYEPR